MRVCTKLKSALFAKEGQPYAPVALPHTWNAFDGQDGGGDYYRGIGMYQIDLPYPTPGKRQYIQFEAANHVATVWCNGRELGTHKGGFSTFRYELTKAMNRTGNVVTVVVSNAVADIYPQRADFTFCGGLYRNVTYIEVEDAHFDLMKHGSAGVFVTPRSTGNTRFDIFPVNAEGCSVEVTILDRERNAVVSGTADACEHTVLGLRVKDPHLWHGVEDPYCYIAVASLKRGEDVLDQLTVTFGYRSYRVDPETGFYLNTKSFPLHGVCRHQDMCDKGWALAPEDHELDARIIADVGANTIRLAHYQHDQYFYDLCDRYGFVLWAEIPFISQFIPGQEAYDNTISQMTELIAQNYNHPSICFWGISNEITIGGFREDLYHNLCDLHALCKRMDPSRLTTMAHIGGVPHDSDHVYITDVQSYNYYFGWYSGELEDNGRRMDQFHADNPDRPYGISEYGADNYTCWHSSAPINHDYTEEYACLYHHHMLKTFAVRPYLWATHQWLMFDFAADQRDEGGFKGINAKGLVTQDRKIFKDSYFLYQAYWTRKPMVHICGRRFTDRAPGERDVTVYTNCDSVTLVLNGAEVATVPVCDHAAVFPEVALREGENTLVAFCGGISDSIVLNGVQVHNDRYDLPDIATAMQAGNWFAGQDDDDDSEEIVIADGLYNVECPFGELLANEDCLRIIKGWIMAVDSMPDADKLVTVSRLTNWRAMWADRRIMDMNVFKNLPMKDIARLNRKLSGIVK